MRGEVKRLQILGIIKEEMNNLIEDLRKTGGVTFREHFCRRIFSKRLLVRRIYSLIVPQ